MHREGNITTAAASTASWNHLHALAAMSAAVSQELTTRPNEDSIIHSLAVQSWDSLQSGKGMLYIK